MSHSPILLSGFQSLLRVRRAEGEFATTIERAGIKATTGDAEAVLVTKWETFDHARERLMNDDLLLPNSRGVERATARQGSPAAWRRGGTEAKGIHEPRPSAQLRGSLLWEERLAHWRHLGLDLRRRSQANRLALLYTASYMNESTLHRRQSFTLFTCSSLSFSVRIFVFVAVRLSLPPSSVSLSSTLHLITYRLSAAVRRHICRGTRWRPTP